MFFFGHLEFHDFFDMSLERFAIMRHLASITTALARLHWKDSLPRDVWEGLEWEHFGWVKGII